jgi:hypothetical protein
MIIVVGLFLSPPHPPQATPDCVEKEELWRNGNVSRLLA